MNNITNVISVIGFSSMILGFIYIGRKLQILDDLKITVDKIKWNLKIVTDFMTKKFTDFDPTEIQAYSPRSLTDVGDRFLRDIGFIAVFGGHKKDFFDFIDGERPKLKYDVETAAIESIFAFSDKEYMSFLKIYFYNHPERNLNNTAATLGLYIRDAYLAEHPEITQ